MASARNRRPLPPGGGLISIFARHGTAANLLMLTLILIGLYSLTKLNRQFFPDLAIPIISVNVSWPGASAEDVEKNILDILEPELRFLDDVDQVISYAREGNATMTLEYPSNANMQKAQSDVEQAIGRITTLPEDSETPTVSQVTFFDKVARISITGPFSEDVLNSYAKQLRDGLLKAGIDRVTLTGNRDQEVRITVNPEALYRLGLTLQDIATKVRENTQDQPAGTLEGDTELQLRARSERKTPEEIAKIEVRSFPDGRKIFLSDVATVRTGFDRDGVEGQKDGKRSVELTVERSLSADAIVTMEKMYAYTEKAKAQFPKSLNIRVYDVAGEFVSQRLNILLVNGLQGLVLVLVTLFIFLNARIAFWTAAGIPIAMLATLGVMLATGQSINMVSMFGLIMMLGIVVDDAIVVGEHAASLEEQGLSRLEAAEQAGVRMMPPVTAATLTTAAAFMPILLIAGRIGDILAAIPYVVMAALAASLIECFLILPGHLRHGKPSRRGPSRWRRAIDRGFNTFRDRVFGPFVDASYRWRYATVAISIALFMIALGLLQGGRVNFVFFPSLPPENLTANVYFAPGVPRVEQRAALASIEQSLATSEKRLLAQSKEGATDEAPADGDLVLDTFTTLGMAGQTRGDNLAQIAVQLTPSESRRTTADAIMKAWRAAVPNIPGVQRVIIAGRRGGPPGRDVDVRLQNGPVEALKKAAEELKTKLTSLPGISAIDDDLPYGKQELVFELTPRGTALGFTGETVGRQLRNAFEGNIATRFALGDEEVTVRVQRAQNVSGPAALGEIYLTTTDGQRVPLLEAVKLSERQTFSLIQRRDGVRTVAVTADLNTDVLTTEAAIERLEAGIVPEIAKKYGLTYRYAGRAEETGDSFRDLQTGMFLALALIYIILGWVFADYWKPLAVMAIVPFGFVGAVFGHYVMGFALTIISMIGLLGLSGILVNDSIVYVSRMNERLRDGEDLPTAATQAARDRLRAVMLTSITTIAGLFPLTFETSLQAQFLIPLAITIVYGVAAATLLVLILVPALVGIGADVGRIAGGIKRLYIAPPDKARPEPAE
ncbi:MAG: efflux RND transporter permease subunit [Pseudomonadota bacterium]